MKGCFECIFDRTILSVVDVVPPLGSLFYQQHAQREILLSCVPVAFFLEYREILVNLHYRSKGRKLFVTGRHDKISSDQARLLAG